MVRFLFRPPSAAAGKPSRRPQGSDLASRWPSSDVWRTGFDDDEDYLHAADETNVPLLRLIGAVALAIVALAAASVVLV